MCALTTFILDPGWRRGLYHSHWWGGLSTRVVVNQQTTVVRCVYQLFVTNRAVVGYQPLGGLLLFLHLLPLWFTSLETVLLAQNGYQMQAAGIGESWPQRNLLWKVSSTLLKWVLLLMIHLSIYSADHYLCLGRDTDRTDQLVMSFRCYIFRRTHAHCVHSWMPKPQFH